MSCPGPSHGSHVIFPSVMGARCTPMLMSSQVAYQILLQFYMLVLFVCKFFSSVNFNMMDRNEEKTIGEKLHLEIVRVQMVGGVDGLMPGGFPDVLHS